jgi:hypothetical protein
MLRAAVHRAWDRWPRGEDPVQVRSTARGDSGGHVAGHVAGGVAGGRSVMNTGDAPPRVPVPRPIYSRTLLRSDACVMS